jgi:hypothetical protein
MSDGTRNVLIVLAIGAAVYFLPGGGDTAQFVASVLSVAISLAFALIGARLYREYRVALYGLGDRHRALLYGAVGLAVLAMAAIGRLFDTGAGIVMWFVLVGAASLALAEVVRHWRSYD